MKLEFIATAEHNNGQSVGHPCRKGIYDDPTEQLRASIKADSVTQADEEARAQLEQLVDDSEPCDCQRKAKAGSNNWWVSVSIHLWPQNEAAMDEVLEFLDDGQGGLYDPYGLIPKAVKEYGLAKMKAAN